MSSFAFATQDKVGSGAIGVQPWMEKIMSLSLSERAVLATMLLDSLDVGDTTVLSQVWKDELDRRLHQAETGEVLLRESGEVFDRAFSALS